ncbi:MAG: DNA internalization-related competence protein ComEC/Rec2 [Clostridia bacterium]|nr:DNA internalization-related competence protein ComEC/Rec2 [Clostridia bacterium]
MLFLCLFAATYTKTQLNEFDNKYATGTNLNLEVTILTHKEESEFYYKYTCRAENKDKFILFFRKNATNVFRIGDKLSINGEFTIPDLARNKGGFNYRRFLNSNGIYGNIKVENNFVVLKPNKNLVYTMQNLIYDNFEKIFSKEHAGILSGMIIGETSNISDVTKDNFQKAGVTHLLAVSGSNVALVITFSSYIFSKIFGKRYSDYVSIVFVVFFVMLAGASPSVVRAGIMAILSVIANILIRKSSSITNVFSSAFLILLMNPLSILNVGFVLSFVGTIGIITLSNFITDFLKKYIKNKILLETVSITMAAQVALIPIMLYYFNSLSLISIFSNLLIIPITSLVTILGIIIFVISIIFMPLAKLVSILIVPMLNYILVITKVCSKFDFLNLLLPTPKIWMIVAFYVLLCFEVYKFNHRNDNYLEKVSFEREASFVDRMKKYTYTIIVVFISLLVINKFIPKNYVELTAIDVGQGDAFLIITENQKTILVDGGGSETSDYDVGANILVPYLLDRGIMKLDYVFVSHAHADHIDGIYSVLKSLNVGKIYIGPQLENDAMIEELYSLANKKRLKIEQIKAKDMLTIDEIKIEILYPGRADIDTNVNNLSLIMKFTCNGRKILFTGDAEEKVEESLVADIEADILKVGHHGSRTSSSEEFVKKVLPKISLISVSENNTYGHPNKDVLERLQKVGKVFMTKDFGEINIRIYKNSMMHIFTFLENTTFILK